MPRVQERRRGERVAMVCPVSVLDKTGRVLLRGRTADIAPGGVRIVGPGRLEFREGIACWVELSVPNPVGKGRPWRLVKLRGQVRRTSDMGQWKSIVVVFENDIAQNLFSPIG